MPNVITTNLEVRGADEWVPEDPLSYVSFRVQNTGSQAFGQGANFGVYLSKDATVTTNDYRLDFVSGADQTSLNVGAGFSDGVTTSVLLPAYGTDLGLNEAFLQRIWYVAVISDDDNAIAETGIGAEGDNVSNVVEISVERPYTFDLMLHPVGMGQSGDAHYSDLHPFQTTAVSSATRSHLGADWNRTVGATADEGDYVFSIFNSGQVVYADAGAGTNIRGPDTNYGYGGVVVVEYTIQSGSLGFTEDFDFTVLYAHLENIPDDLPVYVDNDDVLGTIGLSSYWNTSSPHLHMSIMQGHGLGREATFIDSTYPTVIKSGIFNLFGNGSTGTAFGGQISFARTAQSVFYNLDGSIADGEVITVYDPAEFVSYFQNLKSGGGGPGGGGALTSFYGTSAHDTRDGTSDGNWMEGKEGADQLNGLGNNDTLLGQSGNDTLMGGTQADVLLGGRDDDLLQGGADDDDLIGGKGDDTLDGGTGADRMVGGTGADFYRIDESRDRVSEARYQGNDTVESSISLVLNDLSAHVENLQLTGSALIGGGNGRDNIITGTSGANALSGRSGNDTLIGLGGADTLDGGLGADRMEGGYGRDVYRVNHIGDRVIEHLHQGEDQVNALVDFLMHEHSQNLEHLTLLGSGNIIGGGNRLDNRITGNDAKNLLTGQDGDDTLSGQGGNDTLDGGAGDDELIGGLNSDRFIFSGAFGDDTVTDFHASDAEKIDLSGVADIHSFYDMLTNHLSQSNGNSVITAATGAITLEGITNAQIGYGKAYDPDDFIF